MWWDLTGTIHGAGGVGGLLMIGDGSATHLPVYDANGNVRGLLNGSTGAWTAAYGYSAFGEVLQAVGSYAAANPSRDRRRQCLRRERPIRRQSED